VLYEFGYCPDSLADGIDDCSRLWSTTRSSSLKRRAPSRWPVAAQAALKGQAIGFTIVSITLSLVAVLFAVPDGQLCRLAVPRVRGHRDRGPRFVVGDFADAYSDDVRPPAKPEAKQHGWFPVLERGFDRLLALYERGSRSYSGTSSPR
jgi:hypothetical protein